MQFVIFVERVWDDETFAELKEFITKKGPENCHLYCLSPANFSLMTSEQGCQMNVVEYSILLDKRYKELQKMGCKIQLHLHLSMRPEKMDQEPLFKEATTWMRELGFECQEIAYGWYLSSTQSREMEKKYGLKWEKGKWKYNLHCYELHGNIFSLIMILQNLRNQLR